jgi:hypothetical protein
MLFSFSHSTPSVKPLGLISVIAPIFPMRVNSPKCCIDLVTLPQEQLMVAKPQVQGIKNLGLSKGHQRSPPIGAWHICLNGSIYSLDDNPHTCNIQSNCQKCISWLTSLLLRHIHP